MCGRYALGPEPWSAFQVPLNLRQPAMNLQPSWNVKPTQPAPIVRSGVDGPVVQIMHWGFQFEIGGRTVPGFNARSETVASTWPFRRALGKRPCLVPATGFYEWTGSGTSRTPHFIYLRDQPVMFMAGLWDRRLIRGAETPCFTLLTTAANSFMRRLHSRMPILLSAQDGLLWLIGQSAVEALTPLSAGRMAEHPVAPLKGDHAGLVAPVVQSDFGF